MKRTLSLLLAFSIICTLVFTFTVSAEGTETFGVAYTTPNTKLKLTNGQPAGNYIGVNQETIEIAFEKAIESANGITLSPAPIGGIVTEISDSVVTLKFGELAANTTYTLTIPENSVRATDGTYADSYTDAFQTVKKDLLEDDFSDTAYETQTSGMRTMTSGVSVKNKTNLPTATINTLNGDSYLRINAVKGMDFFMGAIAPQNNMSTSKIVSRLVFNAGGSGCQSHRTGSLYGWNFGEGMVYDGYNYSSFSDFTTNDNGFYDVTVTDSVRTNAPVADNKIGYTAEINAFSNIGNGSIAPSTTSREAMGYDIKLYSVAPVKMYTGTDTDYYVNVSYMKSGYYTIPNALGEPVWDSAAKTITYRMNTELASADGVTVGDLPTTAVINNTSRTLTLTYDGKLRNGSDYTINLSKVVSNDGFCGAKDVTFNNGLENTDITVLYTTPNRDIHKASEKIGVNQGEIEIGFSEAIVSGADGITLTPAPVGGVKASASGKVVTLKFGELTENTTYTLTIPNTLEGVNGNMTAERAITFVTAPKAIAEDDFDDLTFNNVTLTNESSDAPTYVISSTTDGDSYLSITPNGGSDFFLWTTSGIDNMANAKVVSRLVFGEASNKVYNEYKIGGFYGWVPGQGSLQMAGPSFSNFEDFVKNSNSFYDVVIEDTVKTKGAGYTEGNNKLVKTDTSIDIYDNLGTAHKSFETTDRAFAQDQVKLYSTAHVKLYTLANNCDYTANISYLKTGFYTIPDVLFNNGYDKNTNKITFIMNTDLDAETLSGIKINGQSAAAHYANRVLELTPSSVSSNADFIVTFDGVKSNDGFNVRNTATVSNKLNITDYSFKSNGRVIENLNNMQNVVFEFSYENGGEARDISAVIAEYQGNKLINLSMKNITALQNESNTASVSYAGITAAYNTSVKAMLWDMEKMAPLTTVKEITMSEDITIQSEAYTTCSNSIHTRDLQGTVTGGWGNNAYTGYKNIALSPFHNKITVSLLPHQSGNVKVMVGDPVTGTQIGTIVITDKYDGTPTANAGDYWSTKNYYKEYSASLDLSGVDTTNPVTLYIVSAGPSGICTDWYKIEKTSGEIAEP